jgi:hypothetical protein
MLEYSVVYVVRDEVGDERFEEGAVDVYLPSSTSERCISKWMDRERTSRSSPM